MQADSLTARSPSPHCSVHDLSNHQQSESFAKPLLMPQRITSPKVFYERVERILVIRPSGRDGRCLKRLRAS